MCPQVGQFYKKVVLRLNEHGGVIETQTIRFVPPKVFQQTRSLAPTPMTTEQASSALICISDSSKVFKVLSWGERYIHLPSSRFLPEVFAISPWQSFQISVG